VWDVCVDKKEGDIITGCGDGVIRVFSSNSDKWLSQKEIDIYYNDCLNVNEEGKGSEVKKGNTCSNPKTSDLPLIDYIYKNKGKEGEIRAFNNKGIGEAWMVKDGKWEKIGDLIDSSENQNEALNQKGNCTSTIGSKYYEGDSLFPEGEYDFVFDVELGNKITKLPFNLNGNKLVSAEKFCRREKLHVMYQEDIIKFLNQNAQSKANTKQSNQSNNNRPNDISKGKGYNPNMSSLQLLKFPLIALKSPTTKLLLPNAAFPLPVN
jgi:phospholipase A-2-activating protein